MAIIDNEEYYVGDYINEARVIDIGKNYVLLEKGDSILELDIPPSPENGPEIDLHEHRGRTRK